jgi:hypothetical protein
MPYNCGGHRNGDLDGFFGIRVGKAPDLDRSPWVHWLRLPAPPSGGACMNVCTMGLHQRRYDHGFMETHWRISVKGRRHSETPQILPPRTPFRAASPRPLFLALGSIPGRPEPDRMERSEGREIELAYGVRPSSAALRCSGEGMLETRAVPRGAKAVLKHTHSKRWREVRCLDGGAAWRPIARRFRARRLTHPSRACPS